MSQQHPNDVFVPGEYYYSYASDRHFAWDVDTQQWIEFVPAPQPPPPQAYAAPSPPRHAPARPWEAQPEPEYDDYPQSAPKPPPYIQTKAAKRYDELNQAFSSCKDQPKWDPERQKKYLSSLKEEAARRQAEIEKNMSTGNRRKNVMNVDRGRLNNEVTPDHLRALRPEYRERQKQQAVMAVRMNQK